jgi:hypothetical protein
MSSISTRRTRARGSVLLELPLVLWALFFTLFFPLINLTTVFIRYTFLYAANHTACLSAARARSYLTSLNGDPTAISLAQDGSNAVTSAFTGVHVTSVQTSILITNITTGVQTLQSTPLSTPADVNNYTYQIQVTTIGATDPLFPIPLAMSIPGLNAPLTAAISNCQYFENPQGLIY